RELPAFLARVHHRFRTPYLAILINSALALALGLAGSFAQMAAFAAISRLAIYISTCGALLILRRKLGEPEGFRVPGGRGVAVIGIAFCLWLITTRSLAQAWFLPVVMAVGAATWALAEKARKRDGEAAID
ncbi:MAG: amino acid permease, partial [Gemmatimonadota bacterium]|nr:amino acid permease [Gemmatimonadota bacterium]